MQQNQILTLSRQVKSSSALSSGGTLPPIILKDCKNLVPNNTKTISTKCILVVVTCNIIYCTMKTIRCLVDIKSINTTFENYKV